MRSPWASRIKAGVCLLCFFIVVLVRPTRVRWKALLLQSNLLLAIFYHICVLLVLMIEKAWIILLLRHVSLRRNICSSSLGLSLLFVLLFFFLLSFPKFFKHILVVKNRVCELILESLTLQEIVDTFFNLRHLEYLMNRRAFCRVSL